MSSSSDDDPCRSQRSTSDSRALPTRRSALPLLKGLKPTAVSKQLSTPAYTAQLPTKKSPGGLGSSRMSLMRSAIFIVCCVASPVRVGGSLKSPARLGKVTWCSVGMRGEMVVVVCVGACVSLRALAWGGRRGACVDTRPLAVTAGWSVLAPHVRHGTWHTHTHTHTWTLSYAHTYTYTR